MNRLPAILTRAKSHEFTNSYPSDCLVVPAGGTGCPVDFVFPGVGATVVDLIVGAAVLKLAIHRASAGINWLAPPVAKCSRMRILAIGRLRRSGECRGRD